MDEPEPLNTDPAPALVARTAGATAVVGLFIMASAVIVTITGLIGLQNVLVGALIGTLASVRVFQGGTHSTVRTAITAVLVLLGLWMIASPFVFGVSRDLVVWLNVTTGIIVVLLSAAGIYGNLSTTPSSATET